MRLPFHLHWPLPWPIVAAVLIIGAALVALSVVMRRKRVIVPAALLWNGAIAFAFMSPHNRHVFHLPTHQASVLVNAAIGVLWLAGCVVAIAR